jgi:ABC-type nitrate/sulfonate/bicarbonate transport system substrate-binding protein
MIQKIALFLFWVLQIPYLASADALKEIRVGSSNISVTNLVSFYARDKRFYEAEGFDAKMLVIKTEAAVAAMVTGELDYATFSTASVEATLRGMPLRLLAVTNLYPLQGLVVRKGINSVSDLKSKKISISSFGGSTYGAAIHLLRSHGLKPKEDVVILAGGSNPARVAALKNGAVDAALLSAPEDIRAAAEGLRILLDVGTEYRLPWGGVCATQAKVRSSRSDTERFVRATLKAGRAITEAQNKYEVTAWLGKFFRLDDRMADEFYRRLVPSLNPSGIVDRDKIKLVIDSAVERGLTDKPLDPDAVSDFSIVRQLRF